MSRYFILALCSGAIGFLASLVFWTIYYLQTFDAPVSVVVRIESALIGTVAIILVPVVVMYRSRIMEYISKFVDDQEV